jgi:hydrogenase/urease accessory protein HupE
VPERARDHRLALNRRVFTLLLSVVVAALVPGGASAHSAGLSTGDYRVSDGVVRALYVFSGAELAAAFPDADADQDGRVSSSELSQSTEAIDGGIVRATIVRGDGSSCASHLDSVQTAAGDAVEVRATFSCDRMRDALSIDCEFVDVFSASHRHLATVITGTRTSSFVVVPAQKTIEVDLGAPRAESAAFAAMVWMGVTHIWTGYDHLAFLLGLVLLGGRVRTLVAVISAFTVAHSITLGLAVLGIVSIRPSIVEPAIALSIAYVGLENVFGADPAKRWRITFPFGLVHGFGFAGALRSLALPPERIPAALLGFNLGVELGQIAVLAVVLPVVLWARRDVTFRVWGVRALSAVLATAGCVLFAMRIRG